MTNTSPDSAAGGDPGVACRTFGQRDRIKRRLIVPAATVTKRSSPSQPAITLDEPADGAGHDDDDDDDEFAFNPSAERKRGGSAEQVSGAVLDALLPPPKAHRAEGSPIRLRVSPMAHRLGQARAHASRSAEGSGELEGSSRRRPGQAPSWRTDASESRATDASDRSGPASAARPVAPPRSAPTPPSSATGSPVGRAPRSRGGASPGSALAPSSLSAPPSQSPARPPSSRPSAPTPSPARTATPQAGVGARAVAPAAVAGPSCTALMLALLSSAVADASVVEADEAEVSSDEEDDGGPRATAQLRAAASAADARAPAAGAGARAPRVISGEREMLRTAVQRALDEAGGSSSRALHALLEQGADVDARDADGNFPLYLSCHLPRPDERLACARALLRRSADANCRRRGMTALNFALLRAHVELVQQLLRHGGYPVRWTEEAAASADAAALAGGARAGGGSSGRPGSARPPARGGLPSLARFARAHGFESEASSRMRQLLLDAVDASNTPAVEGLLAHGCAPNLPDAEGRTPLFRAVAAQRRGSVIHALLRGGADADTRDACATHVLVLPIMRSDAAVVRLLLKYRANPLAEEGGVSLDVFARQNSSSDEVHALLARCVAHAHRTDAGPAAPAAAQLPAPKGTRIGARFVPSPSKSPPTPIAPLCEARSAGAQRQQAPRSSRAASHSRSADDDADEHDDPSVFDFR